jgi:hypothetical protein
MGGKLFLNKPRNPEICANCLFSRPNFNLLWCLTHKKQVRNDETCNFYHEDPKITYSDDDDENDWFGISSP